jgi:hypothetical protein
MPTFQLADPLDFTKVTNAFLYGQETTPVNFSDRLRATSSPDVTLEIDAPSFMSTGPGRYALPYFAPFVRTFFENSGSLPPAVQTYVAQRLAQQSGQGPVSVSVAELRGLVSGSDFDIVFQQRGWGATSDDYGARTYIYNTETFI